MAWGWLRKAAGYGVRAGTAFATGGASEAYRAATGHADPITQQGENLATSVVNKVTNSTGDQGAPPGESPADAARRHALEGQRDQDIGGARSYADYLKGEAAPAPRAAPQIVAPGAVAPAQAGAPLTIGAAPQVSSTFNGADQAQIGQQERAYLDRLRSVEAGTAGASAAEQQMAIGNRSAVASQYALASGGKGYSSAAARAAGRNAAALEQQNNAQTGVLRAQEQAAVRSELGNALTSTRAGDLGAATTAADLNLRAGTANQSAYVDVQKANQGAKLQTDLANAGFSQQAMLHMSDQELQAKLANAGYQMSQEQIDDLRAYQHQQTLLQAQGQVLAASGAAAGSAQDRMLQLQQLQQQYEAARQRGDAANTQMWATAIGYLTGGTAGAAVAKTATAGASGGTGGAPVGPGSYPDGSD